MSSNINITKQCTYCGADYTAKTLVTRYCSHICNRKHYKQLKREEKVNGFIEAEKAKDNPIKSFDATIQNKEFLNLNEAALLLGASKRTLQRLIATDKLKAGKLGSRTILKRSEIDKLFN